MGGRLTAFALIWAGFLAFSFAQAPIPGPNEPHYLCKAKHLLERDYCEGNTPAGDLFLDSADAHLVFYATVAPLTRFLSLEQTALVGRLIGYAILAFGWMHLLSKLHGHSFAAVWSAWVFLGITAVGNLSGEWIVGGIESKVFSYGFLFLSLGECAGGRWRSAGVWAGLAISFHPVVGCWGLIAGVMATVAWRFTSQQRVETPSPSFDRRRAGVAVGLLVLFSLPGLIPAVMLLAGDGEVDNDKASRIQIFERLPHHLDPTKFKQAELGDYELQAAWIGYGFLFLFWLALHRRRQPAGFANWFGWFVIASAVIAVVGYLIGDIPRLENGQPDPDTALFSLRVKLMKLYPFRLFDIVLPIAAAAVVVDALRQFIPTDSPTVRWKSTLANACIFSGFLAFSVIRPIADRNPSHMRPAEHKAWLETCRWIDENLPADAHVRTPHSSWAFKWYARRAEYWSNKDCPQDAAGILEWDRRRRYIERWNDEQWDDGYPKRALAELYEKEQITHLIVYARHAPSIPLKPIYPADPTKKTGFHVYRLSDAVEK